ncbi:MAG: nucleotidyltransferase family protein [Bacteroidia bacterium]
MNILKQHSEHLKTLCEQHNVETLYVFGSANSDTMKKDSDVDLLVKFKPFNIAHYFTNYMELKRKLQTLFNRDVDLLEEQTLSNPFLIKSIEKNKTLIYG